MISGRVPTTVINLNLGIVNAPVSRLLYKKSPGRRNSVSPQLLGCISFIKKVNGYGKQNVSTCCRIFFENHRRIVTCRARFCLQCFTSTLFLGCSLPRKQIQQVCPLSKLYLHSNLLFRVPHEHWLRSKNPF